MTFMAVESTKWSTGTLQESTTVNGTYTNVPNASPPSFTTSLAGRCDEVLPRAALSSSAPCPNTFRFQFARLFFGSAYRYLVTPNDMQESLGVFGLECDRRSGAKHDGDLTVVLGMNMGDLGNVHDESTQLDQIQGLLHKS